MPQRVVNLPIQTPEREVLCLPEQSNNLLLGLKSGRVIAHVGVHFPYTRR